MAEAFPAVFGRYQLVERIGSGGMAELFLAEIAGPGDFTKRVVIKRLLPELTGDQEIVARFLEEARLSALLSHPNVVQVFELGDVGGDYYIAMEHIQGADLRRIERLLWGGGAEVPIGIAAAIVAGVCRGLDHSHGLSVDGVPMCIVHRDVSPSNVLVSFEGGVKLIDFGVARAHARARLTKHGTTIMGKLVYASPEQVLGLSVTARSDIFSVGCLLYEALTGVRPFERDSEPGTLTAITRESAVAPTTLRPAIPAALEEIVLRALARNPAERFPTAAQMARALESFVAERGQQIGTPQIAGFVQAALEDQDAQTVTRLGEARMDDPRAVRSPSPRQARAAATPPAVVSVAEGFEDGPTTITPPRRPEPTLQGPFVVRAPTPWVVPPGIPPDTVSEPTEAETSTSDFPSEPTVVDSSPLGVGGVVGGGSLLEVAVQPTAPLSSYEGASESFDEFRPPTEPEKRRPDEARGPASGVTGTGIGTGDVARIVTADVRIPLGATGVEEVRPSRAIPLAFLGLAVVAAAVAAALVVVLWPSAEGEPLVPAPSALAAPSPPGLPPLPLAGPPPAPATVPAAAPVPSTVAAPAPDPRPAAPPAPSTKRKLGRLRIASRPPGWVEIDGVRVADTTPLIGYGLEPGNHRIRVVNDRYGRSATVVVKIRANKVVSRTLRLRKNR